MSKESYFFLFLTEDGADDPNDELEQELDEDMAQLDYFPSNPNGMLNC